MILVVVLDTWFRSTSHLVRKRRSTKHPRLGILMNPRQIQRFSPAGDAYSELEYLFSILDVQMSQKMLQLGTLVRHHVRIWISHSISSYK